MVKSLKNSLKELTDSIDDLYEVKRINILSEELLKKYKTKEELKKNESDPLIIEFKEILADLNALSSSISQLFKDELGID